MKIKILLLTVIFFAANLLISTNGQAASAAPGVSANNAVLIEQSTGRVLFEKDAHSQESIASITKIMTAIIAIESGKMKEKVTVSREAIYTEGSSIYLEQGEKMTLEDLVYGLMLRSGNDAAVAIAEHVGGSLDGFVYLMNEKAKWLGMENTHFDNPHGLDSDNHYSSAYDMAILTQYAMNNEKYREISGTTSYKSDGRTYSWINKNKLLTQYYEYCTGGKTGFTKKTGRTLVSTASKDGMDLIAVTLNAPDDWKDHMSLYEWGFENFDMKTLTDKGEVKFNLIDLNKSQIGFLRDKIHYPLSDDEEDIVTFKNYILKDVDTSSGDNIIGKKVFYLNDKEITETPIYAVEDSVSSDANKKSFMSEILSFYKKVTGM
ncbi:D-alanyl-D-alanine carboxypeptidase [Bacilli bacterium]|uniref:D-alanyl-D-alanine carboxypeptidase family protein n=1 Tax=Oceanobacillus TaxID=182709 RepID=UPI000621D36F|nr:D-alanyl-D-alanine carboxypeptidase family protein [Oceanobacillus caeni]KKE79308.1 D-alanyl-D-alanine carboxypeptidase [Bacilli bacterium VT-13-104]PZD83589.1 D-alanyl-D-alanine carboxypeptidase [Bacilli bacterium]MBU8789765.1 D-alanyl-D-alanine carboxypeptidase [Oceanobacillus caeni]PZD88403.1 D-alanyl-D-alanine carboxypeptidase [Bacilli bacterium]PZD92284.1 D-alanyl-D-alanine carboxypeptidase [Bacilli bacterium]